MPAKPPAMIEDMQTLYYAELGQYKTHLQKYMQPVPPLFVIVFWPQDNSYCLLGTDENFDNWDSYTNYSFRELRPALELPDTIFRLPGDFKWVKV